MRFLHFGNGALAQGANAHGAPHYSETLLDRAVARARGIMADESGRVQAPARRRGRNGNGAKPAAPMALVAFTAAAHEHTEPADDRTTAIGTSQTQVGPLDVPAYGFLRHVILQVESTGGTAGPGVLHEDSPFRALTDIVLLDVNGAPIFGPFDGFDTFLANLYGGYAFQPDPRSQPDADVASVVGWKYQLRLPVEISHHDGMGCIAAQNAASAYKVRYTVNTNANIWSTAPTTAGSVRVRIYGEYWSQPTPRDAAGRPQALVPPEHGVTQYWSKMTLSPPNGSSRQRLTRMGQLIRNVIFICRTTSTGLRSTANFPATIVLNYDARQLFNETKELRRTYAIERTIHASGGIPAGVFVYSWSHDNAHRSGDDQKRLWLPTVQATRMELEGSFGAACDLTVITNDIAPVEVTQSERFEEFSDTGFVPETAGV